MTTRSLLTLELRLEHDVAMARQRARQIAALFGFDTHDQTRIATAVSEIVRNAVAYAGQGRVEYLVTTEPLTLVVRVSDQGPGIADLIGVLSGSPGSPTGMGTAGAPRLMDRFTIESQPGQGTVVEMGKRFPRRIPVPSAADIDRVAAELSRQGPPSPLEIVRSLDRELMQALEEMRAQKEQLALLNGELEDTNRGVVALLAELDERAEDIKRSSDAKMRFLASMTHEFRTPVNSILSLVCLLLDRYDGPLTAEQEKQVMLIQHSAKSLSDIIDDLLELAKAGAGKIRIQPSQFSVASLFSALRGMMRPLLAQNTSVSLHFEEPQEDIELFTDESKLSQILRNLISNGLKYTECGEVTISASRAPDDTVIVRISDTGIGIPPEAQERIFEEFIQLDSPLHQRSRGTGLGLSLSRKLAALLGGTITLDSTPGQGSTFCTRIPICHEAVHTSLLLPKLHHVVSDPRRLPVLVVAGDPDAILVYRKYLRDSDFQVLHGRTVDEARRWLELRRPAVIILDVHLGSEDTWSFVSDLKRDLATRDIPVLVITVVEQNEGRALAEGADVFALKPIERRWLLAILYKLIRSARRRPVLIIDDDATFRYLLRTLISETDDVIVEAVDGQQGCRLAQVVHPRLVFLDLVMPAMDGYEVVEWLQRKPGTRDIPIIVHTAMSLTAQERRRLDRVVAILPKASPSWEAAAAAVCDALTRAAHAAPGESLAGNRGENP